LRGVIRPAMVEALRRCSANFKTAMLTNNFKAPAANQVPKRWSSMPGSMVMASLSREIHALFDEIIESSVVGVRKPEPRFYEIACERLGVGRLIVCLPR
jgi:putative hydrolase of the HAD superfamily